MTTAPSNRLSVTDAFHRFARFFKSLDDSEIEDFKDVAGDLSPRSFNRGSNVSARTEPRVSPKEMSGSGADEFAEFSTPQTGDENTQAYLTFARAMDDLRKAVGELIKAVTGEGDDDEDENEDQPRDAKAGDPPGDSLDQEGSDDRAARRKRDEDDSDHDDAGGPARKASVKQAQVYIRKQRLAAAKSEAERVRLALEGAAVSVETRESLLAALMTRRPPEMYNPMVKAKVDERSFSALADAIEASPTSTAEEAIAARVAANKLTMHFSGAVRLPEDALNQQLKTLGVG